MRRRVNQHQWLFKVKPSEQLTTIKRINKNKNNTKLCKLCHACTVVSMHLDGGGAVEAERLGLAVLQVDLQDVGHEEQRVVLDWVLRAGRRNQDGNDSHWNPEARYELRDNIMCFSVAVFSKLSSL